MPLRNNTSHSPAESCARVQTLLDAYHDDALDAPQRVRVSRHVARCETCANDLAGLAALRAVLRAPVDVECAEEPAAVMWERVAAVLDDQETVRMRTVSMARARFARVWRVAARPAFATATVAVLAVAALVIQPKTPQAVNVARDTFTIDEIETTELGVLVYESEDTGMTIIWVIEDESTPLDVADMVAS